jgi:hypothetical protein
MPKVTVTVPHNRDPKKVIAKAKPAMEKMVHELQGSNLVIESTETTLDFSFKTFGFAIKGDAEARPSEIEINVDLPFAAMMFKDMAASTIRSSVTQALEKADEEEEP